MSINHKRKEKTLLLMISNIISEQLTNSDISWPTVTSIQLSKDSSNCIVFVSFLSNKNKSLAKLNELVPIIKKELSNYNNNLRKIPNFIFKIDESFSNGQKIDKILENIKKERKDNDSSY